MREVQKRAYKYFLNNGEDQHNQVIEECSEVIKEITKKNRGKFNKEHLKEELGDLMNAIESLIFLYGWDEEKFHKDRLEKIIKYEKKLKQENKCVQ